MTSTDPRRALGAAGEAQVAHWYEARGYEIVARNWRCREGEIDLVLRGGGALVFCEVKTRSSAAFGAPVEAVTVAKQRRLRRLVAAYLQQQAADGAATRGGELRFDVASVGPAGVEVLQGAF